MPAFDTNPNMMDAYNAKGIQYSGVRPTELGSTEYTLVTKVRDRSGSVTSFQNAIVESGREALRACKLSPRADNLLVRVVDFNHSVTEFHGFKELKDLDIDNGYALQVGGGTALYDAVINAINATVDYAKTLYDNDFQVNAIIFVETDGEDLDSKHTMGDVKVAIEEAIASEKLESIQIVLIGVNPGRCTGYLNNFQQTVGIDSYIPIDDFDHKKGAKLAKFVSQSISSQSQALGTGGPSQVLDFD